MKFTKFNCDSCGRSLKVPDYRLGKTVKCTCGHTGIVSPSANTSQKSRLVTFAVIGALLSVILGVSLKIEADNRSEANSYQSETVRIMSDLIDSFHLVRTQSDYSNLHRRILGHWVGANEDRLNFELKNQRKREALAEERIELLEGLLAKLK